METEGTYPLIANILSQTFPVEILKTQLAKGEVHWDDFVVKGSQHLLLPALYSSLQQKKLLRHLPEDLLVYLKEIYTINKHRNERIMQQAKELATLLSEHQINYVFLKGVALLSSVYHPDYGYRMIGDIDILVEASQAQIAYELLLSKGYEVGHKFNYQTKNFRHLNRLVHPKNIAAIEIHTELLNGKYRKLLPAKSVLNSTNYLQNMHIPSEKATILHLLFSTQLNSRAHWYLDFSFKTMVDCLHLNLPREVRITEHLKTLNLGCSFLAYCIYFFDDFKDTKPNKKINKYLNLIKFYKKFKFLHVGQRRIKSYYAIFSERIALLLTNGSYRKHLLKNKIFPKFN